MVVMELGISMVVKLWQYKKANTPIDCTEVGMVKEANRLHMLKA